MSMVREVKSPIRLKIGPQRPERQQTGKCIVSPPLATNQMVSTVMAQQRQGVLAIANHQPRQDIGRRCVDNLRNGQRGEDYRPVERRGAQPNDRSSLVLHSRNSDGFWLKPEIAPRLQIACLAQRIVRASHWIT
jgi:hypothetical protein